MTSPTEDGPAQAKTLTQTPPSETQIMDECEPTVEQLSAQLARNPLAADREHQTLRDDIGHRRRLSEISATMPALTPAQIAAREAELSAREQERELQARHARWAGFVRERGERYMGCRLSNFDTSLPSQSKAVSDLADYCATIGDRIADGDGVMLFGPKGTGKDHLLVALARAAILAGKSVRWQNGMDLFGDIRDAMDGNDKECSLVIRLVGPDVLYLSDPLPPIGRLTEFQAAMLFRILDGRYSRRRPTWCSVNVNGGSELDERLGSQNGDRLRDNAVAIFCDWPSFRRVRK